MSSRREPPFRVLILAGGKATRMGLPKHLLSLPSGKPLYLHQIDIVTGAFPDITDIYISLAQDSQTDDTLRRASAPDGCVLQRNSTVNLKVIFDLEQNTTSESAGPGVGLLAAYAANQQSMWLVVACDFPFLTAEALKQLLFEYQPPVTCFRNLKGFCEPLLGFWSPQALVQLAENHKKDVRSPTRAVHDLGGLMVLPKREPDRVLLNINSKLDWNAAVSALRPL